MNLSGDPYILLSVVNTKLRDFYPTLEELCEEEGVSVSEIRARLSSAGYEYDGEKNAFIAKIAHP